MTKTRLGSNFMFFQIKFYIKELINSWDGELHWVGF